MGWEGRGEGEPFSGGERREERYSRLVGQYQTKPEKERKMCGRRVKGKRKEEARLFDKKRGTKGRYSKLRECC